MTTKQDDDPGGFLSRWSRRKVQVRQGEAPPEPLPAAAPVPLAAPAPGAAEALAPPRQAASAAAVPETPPPPTLADVAALGRDSDYTRFVAPGVDSGVKNAALKQLFSDPQFNVMDGLDIYIDDYGRPDPLPTAMLRKMVQSRSLGLFRDEEPPQAEPSLMAQAAPTEPTPDIPADEDADLRLQPNDAAGPASPDPGAEPDAGRQR